MLWNVADQILATPAAYEWRELQKFGIKTSIYFTFFLQLLKQEGGKNSSVKFFYVTQIDFLFTRVPTQSRLKPIFAQKHNIYLPLFWH